MPKRTGESILVAVERERLLWLAIGLSNTTRLDETKSSYLPPRIGWTPNCRELSWPKLRLPEVRARTRSAGLPSHSTSTPAMHEQAAGFDEAGVSRSFGKMGAEVVLACVPEFLFKRTAPLCGGTI